MANVYDVGDRPRLAAAFTNAAGSAADPSTVVVKYRKPDQAVVSAVYNTDPEVVKGSTGNFYIDVSVTQAGVWRYEWSGTGSVQAAGGGTFEVRDPGAA